MFFSIEFKVDDEWIPAAVTEQPSAHCVLSQVEGVFEGYEAYEKRVKNISEEEYQAGLQRHRDDPAEHCPFCNGPLTFLTDGVLCEQCMVKGVRK